MFVSTKATKKAELKTLDIARMLGLIIPLDFFFATSKKNYISPKEESEISENIKKICQNLKIESKELKEKPNTPLLEYCQKIAEEKDAQEIILIPKCSYFYSLEQNQRLLQCFRQYQADIGFADNFPQGMIFTFIRTKVLASLENIRKSKQIPETLDFVEKIIEEDTNAFDLENLYAPIGLQALRLDLRLTNQHNSLTAQSLKKKMLEEKKSLDIVQWSFQDFAHLVLTNKNLLKSVPKYYQWHLSPIEAQQRLISPYALMKKKGSSGDFLGLATIQDIVKKILDTTDEPIICFSAAITEPSLHPQWKEILQYCLDAGIETIWETSGATWTKEDITQILSWPNQKHLTIIFLIEAIKEDIYRIFRQGEPPLKDLLSVVEECLLKRPEKTFVETVKTKENIDHLFDYYQNFEKLTKNIIINKYNTYRKSLPERRARAMEPLERIDCWHLKRDLVIDWAGDVWMCKQDFQKENILGNIANEDIKSILAKNDEIFQKHLCGMDYCQNCDEYYTFNF